MGNLTSNTRTAPEPTHVTPMVLTVEPPINMTVSNPIPTAKVLQRRRKALSDDSAQRILETVFTP